MLKRKIQFLIMTIIVLAFLALLGTSYAYYQVTIKGNEEEKSFEVTSKVLQVEYIDGSSSLTSLSNGYIYPGQSFIKNFTVKNTGDDTVSYNIILKNIINTFERTKDWTYELKVGEEIIASGTFPTTMDKFILYQERNLTLEQIKKEYVLIVNYNVSTQDQSVDINKTLSATIDIEASE